MVAAVLAGVGAWLPARVVTNHELSTRLDTSDEWIRRRTGIEQRHLIEPGVSTADLATEAGLNALKSAGMGDVDVVVLATTTPDRTCPGSAPEVAFRLGLAGVGAFDVNAVCSGFLYGLATSCGLIAGRVAERVLLVAAETFSTIVDPADRSTAVIFGDGAGAVVLRGGEPDEPGAIGPFDLGSDGALSDLISVAAGGSRQRSLGGPVPREDYHLTMQGAQVYRHAVQRMTDSSRAVLERAGWTPADIGGFVGHQANQRILDAVADQLGIAESARISNVRQVGNTAAASIPIALAHASDAGQLVAGDRVLLTAFGGGLSWGSTVLSWPDVQAVG